MTATRKPLALVAFGALGVVFGDIGSSPLYAMRQVFYDAPGLARDPGAILGVLSLVLWSIVLVVCVKYTGFVMRADHDGEGGTLAMLGLLLNYLGQGGHVLDDPAAGAGPFFALVPHWAIYPMVALSTAAAVIASQALISGAFSLTQQAVNMGYAPRYAIRHTAAETAGQVYMPAVNGILAAGCIAIVLGFRSSDALGAAYGLSVIGTMTITSVVYFVVLRRVWGWPLAAAVPLVGCFLVVEAAFLVANLAKLLSGAWLPLAIGLTLFGIMAIWTDGRARYRRAVAGWAMPVERFRTLMQAGADKTDDSNETAVFLTSDLDMVPMVGRSPWLLANICCKRVLLLKVETTDTPLVPEQDRVEAERLDAGLSRATVRFGFMEAPDVCGILAHALPSGWGNAVFYLP